MRSRPRARRSATGSRPPRSGSRRPRSRAPRASFPGIFPCADGVFPARRCDDARNGHALVTGDDERPLVSLTARDLRVDEHVLDLLRTTGQAIAWPARADDEAGTAAFDRPGAEGDGPLQAHLVVLANRADAASEIDAFAAFAGGKERAQSALELAWESRALLDQS